MQDFRLKNYLKYWFTSLIYKLPKVSKLKLHDQIYTFYVSTLLLYCFKPFAPEEKDLKKKQSPNTL